MQRYIVRRVLQGIVSIFALSLIVFVLVRLSGDPRHVLLGENYTPEQWEEMGRRWALDEPIPVQYWIFVRNLASGDFGDSFYWKEPALKLVAQRLPATAQLAAAALGLSIVVGMSLGIVSAVKRDTWVDYVSKVLAVMGQSIPAFWLGIILIWVFAVTLNVLPPSGREGPRYIVLPAVTLSWFVVAGIMRVTRSAMLDVLDSDYIRTARAKGLHERVVIWVHALRNALIPVVTFIGILLGTFLTGFVVVETIFSWPGMGLLAIKGIQLHDYAIVQAVVIFGGTVFIVTNLLVDILYAYLDPRVKYH